MLRTRVIPSLLLRNGALVKTVNFKKFNYIGDPINTIRIFNELEVDELILLDITATNEKRSPDFKLISEITNECFMPLAYGGGIKKIDDIRNIFRLGVEKIVLNTYAFEEPEFITKAAKAFGSQSIVVSIDVKKNLFGKYEVFTNSGKKNTKIDPVTYAKKMQEAGAGEIFLNSIDRDGTWDGYDINLIKKVTENISIPVIACGGASTIKDFKEAVDKGGASAVSAGSMFVYQAKDLGVLINFPSYKELKKLFNYNK